MSGLSSGSTCGSCSARVDPAARFCAHCGAILSRLETKEAVRRHVVVLFADLVGFTSMGEGLDPEALRAVMDRYFALVSGVIWEHGGVTEKFIGDAVMAVFGMPQISEDDAVRAVQAAVGIVAALEPLNVELRRDFGQSVQVRVGVHSGAVSATYDRAGDFRVVGDTVNTASRLQSAAEPDSVLVSEPVAQALRDRVRLREVAPLNLKGKGNPFRAWRVEGTPTVDASLATLAPLIGRDVELAQLRQAHARSTAEGSGALVTVLGAPGIGKTRLVEEFISGLSGRRVLRARAMSFNRGISHAPIIDLLGSAPEAWEAFVAATATEPSTARAAKCLSQLSQTSGTPRHGAEIEEIAWSLRTFLGELARTSPLVLVWEDLHWAETALLDIVEFLADELAAVPVLQVCTARPELADLRPEWTTGGARGVIVDLAPLGRDETELLVSNLVYGGEVVAQAVDEVCEQVAAASEGNPLFAELLLATDRRVGDPLPHTITAVFAARLDRLPPEDRLVLEMAAVVGRDFANADLDHLLVEEDRGHFDPAESLHRLRRSRLLSGNRLSGRHCFSQPFCRDTTYELSAKRSRLRWHLALADRAAETAQTTSDGEGRDDSMLAYHLEATALLSRQLHPTSPSTADLGRRAAEQLAKQAAQATDRKDLRAAAGLLERALTVVGNDAPLRFELTLWLSDTRLDVGELGAAAAALDALPQPKDILEQAIGSWAGVVQREIIKLRAGRLTLAEVLDVERDLEPRLPVGDHLALCRLHQLRSHRHIMAESVGAAEESLAKARQHAQALGDAREIDRIDRTAVELALWGPTPVRDGLERCRNLAAAFDGSRVCLVPVLVTMAGLLALDGSFEEACSTLEKAAGYAADLRMHSADVALAYLRGLIDSAAGAHISAAEAFDRARRILSDAGQPEGEALMAAYACRARTADGQPVPEVFVRADDADLDTTRMDPRLGALHCLLAARAAADSGRLDRAEILSSAALSCADRMDDLYFRGTVYRDVAAVRRQVGAVDGERIAARIALELFEAKGVRMEEGR